MFNWSWLYGRFECFVSVSDLLKRLIVVEMFESMYLYIFRWYSILVWLMLENFLFLMSVCELLSSVSVFLMLFVWVWVIVLLLSVCICSLLEFVLSIVGRVLVYLLIVLLNECFLSSVLVCVRIVLVFVCWLVEMLFVRKFVLIFSWRVS